MREQILRGGQDVAGLVLWAEARLGELLKSSSKGTFKKGGKKSLPDGITKKMSHLAQELARHKDLIERAIEEARAKDEIPTRYQVLKLIKKEDRQKEEESSEHQAKSERERERENPSEEDTLDSLRDDLADFEDEVADIRKSCTTAKQVAERLASLIQSLTTFRSRAHKIGGSAI